MNEFREYWTFSAIRGALTLLAATGIVALPYAASAMLSLPMLDSLALGGWATYCLLDAFVLLLLAVLLPQRARSSRTVFAQAAAGLTAGGLLFFVGYNDLNAHWLIAIGAAQAGFAAYAEWRIARDTHATYECLSCYATSIALAVATVALPLALFLGAEMPLAIAAFVGLYGACEFSLGSRMLFVEYRVDHPAAPVVSDAWRAEMTQPATARTLATAKGCVTCAECPADALCKDLSLEGEMRQIMAEQQPAIVRTVRVATLLQTVNAGH